MSSSASLSDRADRESHLQQMEQSFAALERATEKYERKKQAAETAEKAVAVTVVPPHHYLWALYAGESFKKA